MSASALVAAEIGFDLAYLALVWWLVALMARRRPALTAADRPAAARLLAACALLALGMLMIPKTCAYVAVAGIGYRALYPRARRAAPA